MKRSPLRKGKPLERKASLERKTAGLKRSAFKAKPKNDKQKADRAEFDASKRIIWKRSGGQCEFMEVDWDELAASYRWRHRRCASEAQDAHHIKRQAQGHDHSPDNLLACCRSHHRWIHDNPAEARRLGYLVHFWEN